jgi:S1-C subfamily serine protease
MRFTVFRSSAIAVGAAAVLLQVGCSSSPPPAAAPNATIEALSAQVERLQSSAAATTIPPTPTAAPTATTAPIATPTTLAPASLSQEEAAGMLKRSTVLVSTETGTGSGISIGAGRVLTNHHVIEDVANVSVRFSDGRQDPGRVLRIDRRRDLALLQSSFTDQPSASMGDSRALKPAENLLAVGYPRTSVIGAQDSTVSRGIYSARWQAPSGVWHVQTDTPVNPGNSGGPLADSQGRVIGVVTVSVRGAVGLNFAVASDEVAAFLEGAGESPPAAPPQAAPAPGVPPPKPELAGHALAQRTVAPGGSVTLSYIATNSGGAAATAVLGASIRAAAGGRWIDDPTNDAKVTVHPGRHTFTRLFRVPAGTPAGNYDIAWSILSEDMRKSHGLEVDSGVLAVTGGPAPAPAQPQPTPTSAVPAPLPQPSAAPADAVRQFYALINSRNYQAAWNLLSPRYRSTLDYDSWARGYQTTRSVTTPTVRTTSQSGSTASVELTVVSVDAEGAATVTKTFQGSWSVAVVENSWKLDNPSIRQVR